MTDKQTLFINSYLTTFNATAAAIEAGYSPGSAGNEGWRLLKNDDIKAEIELRTNEIIAQTNDKRAKIIKFWESILDDPESSSHSKLRASENLGKYLSMFTEKIEQTMIRGAEKTIFIIEKEDLP